MNIFMYIKEHILSLVVLKSGVLCHLTFKDTFIYSRPRVACQASTKANNDAMQGVWGRSPQEAEAKCYNYTYFNVNSGLSR